MTSIESNTPTSDSLSRDFDDYRRACRARFEEQKRTYDNAQEIADVDSNDEEEEDTPTPEVQATTPTQIPTIASAAQCNTTARSSTDKSPVGTVKASNKERRNSFSKFVSSLSNVFKAPPPPTPQEKEKAKAERKKRKQDENMAHLIAQLEFDGKSDEEIQLHLFHLRDIAQGGPRSNSLVGDWFRDMHQAFKDEFSLRRGRQCMTVHIAEVNPFAAAMPANYMHDGGYSYEDLLRLEPVPRGLQSVDHIPTLVYEGQELPSSQTTCAVCMADFEMSEDLRALGCTHHFHKECIDKWLSVAPSCPVCKGEVSNA